MHWKILANCTADRITGFRCYCWVSQAEGMSWVIRSIGKSANPDRTKPR
jgi:hypothetical protein